MCSVFVWYYCFVFTKQTTFVNDVFWFSNLTAVIRDSCGIIKNTFVLAWLRSILHLLYSICLLFFCLLLCYNHYHLSTLPWMLVKYFPSHNYVLVWLFYCFETSMCFVYSSFFHLLIYSCKKTQIKNIFNLKNKMVFEMKWSNDSKSFFKIKEY